jgi:Peptidase A4 family
MLRARWIGVVMAALTATSLAVAGPAAASAATVPVAGPHAGSMIAPRVRNGSVTFQNWAGYAVTSTQYTSVSASWKVPAVTCIPGLQESAFWVGFDGVETDSVEQTGTTSNCQAGAAKYFAWYEMYPDKQVNYTNVVDPGDVMDASVTFDGGDAYTLVTTDKTQDWTQTANVSISGDLRESAEVIVEAPCCTSAGNPQPLADFGKVGFTDAMVDGAAIGTLDPTQIIMVDNAGHHKVNVTALKGNTAFTATWLRRN